MIRATSVSLRPAALSVHGRPFSITFGAVTALPPGPASSASLQTARWLARPIRFLEDCRRAYGDAFSVMFKGFKTPLVIVSHPEAIRALYGERGHHMPPGRQITLKPLVGARSLLLLEGREHLERRKVMLPPFRGDRMRSYEELMRESTRRELAHWPRAPPVRRASEHAGDHARRDPAERSSASRTPSAGSACTTCSAACWRRRRR